MDLFEFAMKMELDGKSYYEKLASSTGIEGFAVIFTRLAADEQKHYDIVKAMRDGSVIPMADTVVLDDAKNVFEKVTGNEQLLGAMKEDLDAYEHSRDLEKESVRLYEEMAAKETNPELKNLFLRLAAEEMKHFNIMENLYDFVLRPKYYLEWREFSNLEQL